MSGSSAIVSTSLFISGLAVGATGAALFNRQRGDVALVPASTAKQQQQHSASPVDDGRELLLGGNPGPIADFLRHVSYISSYDRARRHPHWTAEHITAAALKPPDDGKARGDRRNSVFKEDERVPEMFRSRNADYFRSGYDRGHMVPAADCKLSQQSMDDTFYLTNIAPQVGEGFNRDYWAHVEDFVRRATKQFADLYVFTVPLYLPRQSSDGKWRVSYEVIGDPPAVSVPTHFAKVIFGVGTPESSSKSAQLAPSSGAQDAKGGLLSSVGLRTGQNYTALGAFVLPNAVIPNSAPLRSFMVPVEAVERAAGLQLFPPALKSGARSLCDTIDCTIVVRDFGDRNPQQRRGPSPVMAAPKPAPSA